MPKQWRIAAHDSARIEALGAEARLPAVVARLLVCRGIHQRQVALDFLDPRLSTLRDPAMLPGATQAARTICDAIRERRRIVVYGDYDVDGISGTSILYQCLKLLGADVRYYIPHRIDEGYGLHVEALEQLVQQGAQLVVTVDCGIASVNAARRAAELGIELVITDHHRPSDELPQAAAIVHPGLPGGDYPFAGLCGAGVAFKVAWAVCQHHSGSDKVESRLREFLISAVGLAALGTVADVVPLVDENRVIVQHGLSCLKSCITPGIDALLRVADLDRKSKLTAEDIAFGIAPRLNAAGRLGQAQLGVELLVTTDKARALELAAYINDLNESRKTLERSIYLAARKQIDEALDLDGEAALVLADHGWHPGVIGVVAGRLADKYRRPVVLIGWDAAGVRPGFGSARSANGFDLHAALESCAEHLFSYGGHAAAAGLRIEQKGFDAFRADFCERAAGCVPAASRVDDLAIDAEVCLAELTLSTVEQIERLSPFGHANPRPVLCAFDVRLASPPKKMGGGGRHLSLDLAQHNVRVRGVAFGGGEWVDQLPSGDETFSVAFQPFINEFRGRRTVELQLTDWQPAGGADGAVAVAGAGHAAANGAA